MIHRFVFHNDRFCRSKRSAFRRDRPACSAAGDFSLPSVSSKAMPFAFERHWQRLSRDSERTHCPFPFEQDVVLGHHLPKFFAPMKSVKDARESMSIYNQVGFWRSDENSPKRRFDYLFRPVCHPHRDVARLGIREHGRHAASPLAGVKVTSWLNNVWNLHEAQQSGFDEVVLLNERGRSC